MDENTWLYFSIPLSTLGVVLLILVVAAIAVSIKDAIKEWIKKTAIEAVREDKAEEVEDGRS